LSADGAAAWIAAVNEASARQARFERAGVVFARVGQMVQAHAPLGSDTVTITRDTLGALLDDLDELELVLEPG